MKYIPLKSYLGSPLKLQTGNYYSEQQIDNAMKKFEKDFLEMNDVKPSGLLSPEEIMDTGWIHLEQATLRVHVLDADKIPIQEMEEDESKPDFVLDIGRSSDPAQTKQSILIQVTEGYNLKKLSDWLKGYW